MSEEPYLNHRQSRLQDEVRTYTLYFTKLTIMPFRKYVNFPVRRTRWSRPGKDFFSAVYSRSKRKEIRKRIFHFSNRFHLHFLCISIATKFYSPAYPVVAAVHFLEHGFLTIFCSTCSSNVWRAAGIVRAVQQQGPRCWLRHIRLL